MIRKNCINNNRKILGLGQILQFLQFPSKLELLTLMKKFFTTNCQYFYMTIKTIHDESCDKIVSIFEKPKKLYPYKTKKN